MEELATLSWRVIEQYAGQAHDRGIGLVVRISDGKGDVRVGGALFTEMVQARLDNAFKYTPDYGSIRFSLSSHRMKLTLMVADSGVGIPEEMREKVFEPFMRTGRARNSSRPGTGLGLALVRAIVTAAGGDVYAAKADLGGAEIGISIPVAELQP